MLVLLPIIGYSVLSVLVSYLALRLYRARDWRKWSLWSKAKPSVDLLPITGLPPPPTALPPLVELSTIPRTPSPPVSFYQHINKQIHSTSFPRPPSPHALLATTSPPKLHRRSRSLGGVPVRRLSGGASGLRNVQILDLDVEMQEMNRGTSKEHLLIDFSSSSSGSSDEFDALRKENEEQGLTSRKISPASSDIGVLPFRRRPSLFDDSELPLDFAPGRKVVQLVDLDDVEDGLGVKWKEEDACKWFAPGKIHFTPLESTPTSMAKPISKSISEPLPITSLPLPMADGKLIDFHSGSDQEHVLVDLYVQDSNNVPQQEQPQFIRVHTTRMDAVTETPVDVKLLGEPSTLRSALEGRPSLDSLTTIVDTTTPPIEMQNSISSVEESSQRGYRHPLEEVHEEETKEVSGKVETGPVAADVEEDHQELFNEHENHEFYDHHDDYSYVYDIHHDHHPIQGEELQSSSLSPQVATIPVQAAPAWYWDHEDDPWNEAVGVVNEEDMKEGEELLGEREDVEERGEKVVEEKGVALTDVSTGLEDEDIVKASPGSKELELPVERSPEEASIGTEEEESYPDPDYLPLPALLLDSSPVAATEIPLVLVENGPSNDFQEDEDADKNQDEDKELQQQLKDDEKSPRQVAAQIPTPPASPPPTSLRVKGLGGTVGVRSGPPSPSSSSSMGGLLRSISSLSTPQSASPKLAPLLVLTPPNTSSSSPAMEVQVKTPEVDKENAAGVDKENEMPSNTTGRPLWSIRAGDAPALGLAASSLSISTSSAGLIPGVGTSMSVSPRMKRRVLGDITVVVENGEREQEEKKVEIKQEVVKEDILKEEKDEEDEEESSLPGSFPELLKPTSSSNTNIIAPTITVAALTSTLLSTTIAAASSSTSAATSSSTALESSPAIKRRPIVRSPLDIALAMQLRPGLGVGADPAWMVRFLMSMFGWFAILVSGQGEF